MLLFVEECSQKLVQLLGFIYRKQLPKEGNKFLLKELTIPQDMLLPV